MTDEQTPAPQPLASPKNKGGRPKRNAVATSLAEVVKMMESLSRSEAPNGARQRLLDRQFEYFSDLQKRDDEKQKDRTLADNATLRSQNEALQKENAELRAPPEPEIDIDEMLRSASVVPTGTTPETDHSGCIPKSAHDTMIQGLERQIEQLEKDRADLMAQVETVKDIAEDGIQIRLNNARLWNQNDSTARNVDELEKQHNDLRKKLDRKPLYQPDPPSKEQQEYLEKQNRETQEWRERSAFLKRESVL